MEKVKEELFRAPRGNSFYWVVLGAGALATTLFLVPFAASVLRGNSGDFTELHAASATFTLVLAGVSELIPEDRLKAAIVLRISTLVIALLAITWAIVRLIAF